jgi:hypothetical protein
MLDVTTLLAEAEIELHQSALVKSTVKMGILVSVLQTTLDTYRPGNVAGPSNDMACQLMSLLARAGALDELFKEKLVADPRSTRVERPVPSPSVGASLSPEAAIAQLGTAGLLSPEEQDLLRQLAQQKEPPPAPAAPDLTDPNVIARSDEELAAEEAQRNRNLNGILPFPSGFGEAPEDFFTIKGTSIEPSTS